MAGSFSAPSGGNVTVTFIYTATTAKVQNTAFDAASYLAARQGIDITGYTNQQKLDLVDAHIKQVLLDLAKTHHISQAAESAKITANTEIETRYL